MPPRFEAIENPAAFPLSSGRVVIAISALLAACAVVAVACIAVSSAV